jgi:hypothetical protein
VGGGLPPIFRDAAGKETKGGRMKVTQVMSEEIWRSKPRVGRRDPDAKRGSDDQAGAICSQEIHTLLKVDRYMYRG